MNTFNRQLPTVMLPESIAPAGKRAHEFSLFEIGLIDRKTGLTVDSATYSPDRTYEIVYKTGSKGPDNPFFPDHVGIQMPIRTLPISKIDKAHLFDKATDKATPFIAYLGYDGIHQCKSINLPCGEDMGIFIQVRGQDVRNTFNQNLNQLIPFTLPCCEDCSFDVAAEKTVDTMIEAIRTAPFYVKEYIKVEKVLSCCTPQDLFERLPYKTYQITVCDSGSSRDLAKFQRQYPDFSVERVDRDNPYSTYEVCIETPFTQAEQDAIDAAQDAYIADPTPANQAALDAANQVARDRATADNLPDDFVMSNVKQLECDECPDCPATFTKVDAGDKYLAVFDVSSDVNVTTFEEFELDYYTDQTTAQATIDALLTGVEGLIPNATAGSIKLMSVGTTLAVQVCVTKDSDMTEHGVSGLSLTALGECEGYCKGESTVAWCPKDDKYKIKRTLCLTVGDGDCGTDWLEEIQGSLKDYKNVVDGSVTMTLANGCVSEYKLEQVNDNCLEDGCDTVGKDGAKFSELPYFRGKRWDMCDCEGFEVDASGCLVRTQETVSSCSAGLKFTAALPAQEPIDETHAISDLVNREPLEIEVSIVPNIDSEIDTTCDPLNIDWTITQKGSYAEGRGDLVLRREVISREYDMYQYFDPNMEMGARMRNRLGYEYAANPNKFYNSICLYHNSRQNIRHTYDTWEREIIQIYVEKDNVTLFEDLKDFFNKTLLKMGHIDLLD